MRSEVVSFATMKNIVLKNVTYCVTECDGNSQYSTDVSEQPEASISNSPKFLPDYTLRRISDDTLLSRTYNIQPGNTVNYTEGEILIHNK
jgi:hypothetical protein